MDIYDGRFFHINKKFLVFLGLWPYDTHKKNFIRGFYLTLIVIGSMAQIISIKRNFFDWDRVMENLIYLLIAICGFLKIFSLGMAQKKLRMMFDGMVDNWHMITRENEKQILRKYSENGRRLTIVWSLCFTLVDFFFIFGPLVRIVLNTINPNSEPWPRLYLLNGEYLLIEDKDAVYPIIYCWDILLTATITFVYLTTDTTFFICIEHCLGLFAIVRSRIRMLGQFVNNASANSINMDYYGGIVETIKLHQKTIQFLELIEASYSTCFLYILGYTISVLSLCCISIAINLQSPIQAIRFSALFVCSAVHLFNFCWPGQKLLDISSSLVHETYCNEWQRTSLKSKKALHFFMLRCSNPCMITACGLVMLNIKNFLLIMKSAVSYIMLLGSLRNVKII